MTDFVSNLIKKFKKPIPQDSTITIKPNSKNLVSPDCILLNEHVKVNIYSLKEVNIDKEGVVTGNIHSKSCIVNGKVHGNILSSDYIEVKNTAVIEGNIKSGSIQIEAGSMINGFISIEKKIKLPTIISEVARPDTSKPRNADLTHDGYAAVKTTPVKSEIKVAEFQVPEPVKQQPKTEVISEIKTEQSYIAKDPVSETVADTPKAELPEIKPASSEASPKKDQADVKDKKAEVNPPKKVETPSSNDSWW
jgi:cytoskeletal protein CcmA (bactofilin family)